MTARLMRCLPVILTTAVLTIFACTREPPKARLTVDEYLAHPETMEKTIKECVNNPGELQNDPDCVNAQAASVRHVPRFRDLPPMNIPVPGRPDKEERKGGAAPEN